MPCIIRYSHMLTCQACNCRSLTQMGTQSESFIDLTDRLGRQTGGLSFYPFISSRRGSPEPLAYLMVRGKAMAEKAPELLDVMRDILLTARLDDRNRFKQVRLHILMSVHGVVCMHDPTV